MKTNSKFQKHFQDEKTLKIMIRTQKTEKINTKAKKLVCVLKKIKIFAKQYAHSTDKNVSMSYFFCSEKCEKSKYK